jgi:hypothetical protein
MMSAESRTPDFLAEDLIFTGDLVIALAEDSRE